MRNLIIRKRFFLFSICLIAILFLAVSLSRPTLVDAKPSYSWKFAQPWPRSTVNESYVLFCQLVNQYSNGEIEITFYPNGQLGTHDETFHGLQAGDIEIGVISPYVNLIPGGMLNWMPWTVDSWEVARKAYGAPDGILFKMVQLAYNEVGMQNLFTTHNGPHGIGNNTRPLQKPEDFKNLKMRVSSSLGLVRALENMGKGTGMTLETIPWADLYNALQRGVVDGCWTSWSSMVEERHFEVMEHFTDLRFFWDALNIVMNKKLYDSLTPELQAAIMKAAGEAEEDIIAKMQVVEKEYIERLENEPGFEIVYLTPEERAVFRNASDSPAIWDELCAPWLEKYFPGQNMSQQILDELEEIRKEVSAKN